jgi:predicted aspartyl protease
VAKVIGSIDARGRPVVRVDGNDDSLLVVVDTGFNGDLMVTLEAARSLGIVVGADETNVELGDGTVARVYEARTTIDWLGEQRSVRVLVSSAWRSGGDDPVGLLGTELLKPHLLLVDFGKDTVEIETQQ